MIEALIKSEKIKVDELVRRGATHYYLITNVPGTAHPDSGSVDRANEALTAALSIPSRVWWRDDLDRRLDKAPDVKWAYPQILSATDLELKNLHRGNITAYKDKWIEAQRLNAQESDMVSSTLNDKLEQPHLRDLARNPMRLAILLHLIHVQGAALPEKRTTLYEEYMKLFFNREAEPWRVLVDRAFDVVPRSPVASQIAVLATAAHADYSCGAWSERGFSATRGMVERVYFSRCRHDDVDWWRREVGRVDRRDLGICLAILLSWSDPVVLSELAEVVGDRMESLRANEWEALLRLCNCVEVGARSNRANLTKAWFERGMGLSARMAVVLLGRIEDALERRKCGRMVFAKYEGSDIHVLRGAANCELLQGQTEDMDWDFVCHLSRLGKRAGVELLWYLPASEIASVPRMVTESVLNRCEEHCEQLLAVCERGRSMEVASSAEKVATVAERDKWFAPHFG